MFNIFAVDFSVFVGFSETVMDFDIDRIQNEDNLIQDVMLGKDFNF